MLRCLAALVGPLLCCISHAFADITVPEMFDRMHAQVLTKYENMKCEFVYTGDRTDVPSDMPTAKGEFINSMHGRRVRVDRRGQNREGTKFTYLTYLYAEKDGVLYDNLVGNQGVIPREKARAERELMLLKQTTPWDLESAFAGIGFQTFKDITNDSAWQYQIIKSTEAEVIIDLVRGDVRVFTVYLDPQNDYALTQVRGWQNNQTQFHRVLRYTDGLVTELENKPPARQFKLTYKWAPMTDEDAVGPESITTEGDVLFLLQPDSSKKAFKRVKGQLVPSDTELNIDERDPREIAAAASTQPVPRDESVMRPVDKLVLFSGIGTVLCGLFIVARLLKGAGR